MPEAFKLLQVAENEGPVGMYMVHGKVHKCKIDGIPVLNHALRQVGSLLNKR